MALLGRLTPDTRRLVVVLAVHVLVLAATTAVAADAEAIADQVWLLNVAVVSQVVASVVCAAWLFRARRAVAIRVRAAILGGSARV